MNTNTPPPTSLPWPVMVVSVASLALVAICWFYAVYQAHQRRAVRHEVEQTPVQAPVQERVAASEPEDVFNWAEQDTFATPSIYERVSHQSRMFPRQDA